MSLVEAIRKGTRTFLQRFEVKFGMKSAIAASLAWYLGVQFGELYSRTDKLVTGLWCVVSAIIVLQSRLGGTYKEGWDRFLGILLGSLVGGLYTYYIGSDPLTLGLAVFSLITLMALFKMHDSFKIGSLTVAVVMISWNTSPDISPWDFALNRFLDSLVGILLGLSIAHIFWPEESSKQLRFNVSRILHHYRDLFPVIFSLSQESKPKDFSLQDRFILDRFAQVNDHIDDNRSLIHELRLEWTGAWNTAEGWSLLRSQLKHLFDTLSEVDPKKTESFLPLITETIRDKTQTLLIATTAKLFELSNWLETGVHPQQIDTLNDCLKELEEELQHFEENHKLQRLKFEQLELFFLFFHNLDESVKSLQKIEGWIKRYRLFP